MELLVLGLVGVELAMVLPHDTAAVAVARIGLRTAGIVGVDLLRVRVGLPDLPFHVGRLVGDSEESCRPFREALKRSAQIIYAQRRAQAFARKYDMSGKSK